MLYEIYRAMKNTQGEVGQTSNPKLDFEVRISPYMREALEIKYGNEDLLGWLRGTVTFPILRKMVHDVLAIQASSVASEAAFSAARGFYDQFEVITIIA
uniref:HAT C-terminal dimerisation domain-containing protein n=1 Tax=Solanum lycopersicum TaxID=4081 RepID=A0A3Q7FKM4_SOLLC